MNSENSQRQLNIPETPVKSNCVKCVGSLLKGRKKVLVMHFLLWFGVLFYILAGALIMYAIEVEGGGRDSNSSRIHFKIAKFNVDPGEEERRRGLNEWNMLNSIRFVYGIITTTGTGGMIPNSQKGMIFAIFIGLIGIPLTILVLADMGKFLMDGAIIGFSRIAANYKALSVRDPKKEWKTEGKIINNNNNNVQKDEHQQLADPDLRIDRPKKEKPSGPKLDQGFVRPIIIFTFLLVFVLITSFLPALNIGSQSTTERVFKSFLLVTSLSFGEILPCTGDCLQRVSLMLVYATIGIILMTMSIEAAADGFRKVHYLGAKLKDVSLIPVWFGGTKMTMWKILKPISTKYNIPLDDLTGLVQMTAEGKELPGPEPEAPSEIKPILIEDIQEIFGQKAANDILFLDEDPVSIF